MQKHEIRAQQALQQLTYRGQYRCLKIMGYGARVCFMENEEGHSQVVKLFKHFRPYSSLPFYHRSRARIEYSVYEILRGLDPSLVPAVNGELTSQGILVIDNIKLPYLVLDDYLIANKDVPVGFLDNFVTFLVSKATLPVEIFSRLDFLYTQKTTQDLRSLFVEKQYQDIIRNLFEKGVHAKQGLQCGGLSPKNILVNGESGEYKLVDFEEAFVGDYVFDAAYFVAHLVLYAIAQKNEVLFTKAQYASKKIVESLKFSMEDSSRYSQHIGLLLLHRAEGFNLKGIDADNSTITRMIGGSLLRAEKTFNNVSLSSVIK